MFSVKMCRRIIGTRSTYRQHYPGAVVRRLGYDGVGKGRSHSPSRNRTHTCLGALRLDRCGSYGRTSVGDVYICWKWRMRQVSCSKTSTTYCLLVGSRSLSLLRTRISILLASRYFGMARIILIATFLFSIVSCASTTLPKVPWPNRRTIRSRDGG